MLAGEGVGLAEHCSLAVEEVEAMSLDSWAAVGEAPMGCSAQGAEVERDRDLEVEGARLKVSDYR